MKFKKIFFLLCFTIMFYGDVICLDPFSWGALGVIGSGLYYIKKPIYNAICTFVECCNENEIPVNITGLKINLDNKLFGQHIAKEVVVNSVLSHLNDKEPQKPLTLSFHGLPGTGKNYVTEFIKTALYKNGAESKYAHHFIARIHFTLENKVTEYQENLQNWLKGNVSICQQSIFVFDEVDKMPESVLNAIIPMIDYHKSVENVVYRKSIFIFLSNTGGTIIKDHLFNLWKNGIKRDEVTLKDFESIISKGAFNEKGGFHRSDTIKYNLIDHYVPFLPLEKEHVILCIKDQFRRRNIEPSEENINEILSSVEWGPEPTKLYSKTGCKALSQKVPLVIAKYYRK